METTRRDTLSFLLTGFPLMMLVQPASASTESAESGQQPSSAPAASSGFAVRLINTTVFPEKIQELARRIEQLNNEFEPQRKSLTALQQQINETTEKLRTQGPTMNPAARQQESDKLESLQKRLEREREDTEADYNRRGRDYTGPVLEKIRTFLDTYAAQRGIQLLLDTAAAAQINLLLYAAPGLDLTEDFINEYNKVYPVPGARPANQPAPATQPPKKP